MRPCPASKAAAGKKKKGSLTQQPKTKQRVGIAFIVLPQQEE
jgi:hypothetical protein